MKFTSVLKYFFTWQAVIILITVVSQFGLALRTDYLGGATQAYRSNPLLYSRANFDGNHYLYIAERGYGFAQQAFFPLYPNLIRLLHPFVGTYINGGLLLSAFSFLAGLYIFGRLLRLDFSANIVRWTIVSLLIFPVSFFFSFVYTEGLFFFLVVSAFYLARKNHWLLASVVGGLAAYTRFAGVFLFIALLVDLWQQRQLTLKKVLPLLLIPLGLVVFMSYLERTVGDPLAFIHVQALFNQGRSQNIVLLYQVFWRYVKMLATVNRSDPLFLTVVLEAGVGFVFFLTSVIALFRYRLSYALFAFCCYLLPTLTGSFTSLPRYVLVCFPSFILFAEAFTRATPAARKAYVAGSLTVFAIFLALFIRGYWVS